MKKDELKIELRPLLQEEEETFIRENQAAFDKAAISKGNSLYSSGGRLDLLFLFPAFYESHTKKEFPIPPHSP